jgi:DNA-binding NarL/FixJ family response regulator
MPWGEAPPAIYLEKKSVSAFLTRAIRVVAAGEAWVPRRMVSKIVDQLGVLMGAGGNDGEELSDIRLR